ncbi:MAG: RluA family pseudouridine synthase [Alteromonadaceae bacterium]|nr:RluA family pseudouridine synthase [Alteromonadaceae bacterium]
MHSPENCFTSFTQSIDEYTLPQKFTFPFYYDPHPLCLLAVSELQHHLETQTQWQHNFGLVGTCEPSHAESAVGKMFGILLVQNAQGEIGYLSAFSGKVAAQNHLPKFVPPVFDMFAQDGFLVEGQLVINQINAQIEHLERNPEISEFSLLLAAEENAANVKIEAHRNHIISGRKDRKAQRVSAEITLSPADFLQLKTKLSNESIGDKNQLRDLKIYWDDKITLAKQRLNKLTDEITLLKNKRKTLSNNLQQKLFKQYQFLNIKGDKKSLGDIFSDTVHPAPPAGSGECAAPKLLHYAFKWQMKPLALAEFWWGEPPKSEIRQHKNFYAACQGKCQPILGHMLEGISMDENPLLNNPAKGKTIDIVYQDEDMLVINKPAEFLSVPGKNISDSVYLRIKELFPKATGPLIVHRLDMSTSGLMVIALTKRAHKSLQKQFINRTVKKRYVAIIEGVLKPSEGVINLPLRGDFEDRPRQLVCHQYGKLSETKWQVLEQKNKQTKVHLYPKTGRTHQLRVHCAHSQGFNMPILGDDMYGRKAERLYLHAEFLEINHPITKKLMQFKVEAEF